MSPAIRAAHKQAVRTCLDEGAPLEARLAALRRLHDLAALVQVCRAHEQLKPREDEDGEELGVIE